MRPSTQASSADTDCPCWWLQRRSYPSKERRTMLSSGRWQAYATPARLRSEGLPMTAAKLRMPHSEAPSQSVQTNLESMSAHHVVADTCCCDFSCAQVPAPSSVRLRRPQPMLAVPRLSGCNTGWLCPDVMTDTLSASTRRPLHSSSKATPARHAAAKPCTVPACCLCAMAV